jgi:hypothetical protein
MLLVLPLTPAAGPTAEKASTPLEAGFAEADITPPLGGRTVYLAGFGHGRKATGAHDPLKARAVVLRQGGRKIAVVAADVVGLFHPFVLRVRARLDGFRYVLVCSTHNHEGPDTLGLWGPSTFRSGVDPTYMGLLERQVVRAVRDADAACRPVTVRVGTARAPELLHDTREPIVKQDELVAVEFRGAKDGKAAGLLVEWSCHPETLADKNTLVSSDFVGPAVEELRTRHRCPVVYVSGAVGGLMTSLHVPVRGAGGEELADGTFEKAARYGRLLADAADGALRGARDASLTPLKARSRAVHLPMENPLFRLARQLGVFDREAFRWKGDPYHAEPAGDLRGPLCVRSEVALLRLGELEVAAIPGEIYPELVLGKVQDPPDPGADFPDAPVEPGLFAQLHGRYRMIVGLANDELGYIIPRRQWDEKPPYCYGRKEPQYGEGNSLGPRTAPILCEAFRDLARSK